MLRLSVVVMLLVVACSSNIAGPVDAHPSVSDAKAADSSELDAHAADTWTTFAEGFFQSYCTTCHAPGGQGYRNGDLDFRMFAAVMANADAIRCGVAPTKIARCSGSPAPRQFPIAAPYPDDDERNRLVAWIDEGMLE